MVLPKKLHGLGLGVYIGEIGQSKNVIRIHKILDYIIMRSGWVEAKWDMISSADHRWVELSWLVGEF